jgi:hypothetical protein
MVLYFWKGDPVMVNKPINLDHRLGAMSSRRAKEIADAVIAAQQDSRVNKLLQKIQEEFQLVRAISIGEDAQISALEQQLATALEVLKTPPEQKKDND